MKANLDRKQVTYIYNVNRLLEQNSFSKISWVLVGDFVSTTCYIWEREFIHMPIPVKAVRGSNASTLLNATFYDNIECTATSISDISLSILYYTAIGYARLNSKHNDYRHL